MHKHKRILSSLPETFQISRGPLLKQLSEIFDVDTVHNLGHTIRACYKNLAGEPIWYEGSLQTLYSHPDADEPWWDIVETIGVHSVPPGEYLIRWRRI